MSQTLEHMGRTPSLVVGAPASRPPMPDGSAEADAAPKVAITGDVRLQVNEQDAARGPVRGRYHIQMEGMRDPLRVIWMVEGQVLSQSASGIDVAFDLRGTPAGAILTWLVSAQVTERGGQGCIVHSSIFVQVGVVNKAELGTEREDSIP
jgi:hypothetical protein